MIKKTISIVIPAHNEGKYIEKCLKAITTNCDLYGGATEVIVVDNNSTDDTFILASAFDVKVIQTSATTPAAVRNSGAKLAKNEILAFVDGDCIVTEQWLELINNAYQNDKIGAYGGQHIASQEDNWVVKSWNPTSLKKSYNENTKLPGGNFSIRANVFNEVKGFNEKLTSAEDDHLSQKVMDLSYFCVSDSNNFVIHLGYPNSLKLVYQKQCWHGATQVKAHGYIKDKVVLVTELWIFSCLLLIGGMLSNSLFLIFIGVFGFLICPTLITINRLKYHNNIFFVNLLLAQLISFFYISGRAVGFLKELARVDRDDYQ
jgi:glycosyltransferase involved in cell wall biosynthesis